MSAEAAPSRLGVFSPMVVLGVILVGVFSFSAFVVLFAFAPDLRTGADGGAHALSKSAVGYAGFTALLKARGIPTVISRSPAGSGGREGLIVLTPSPYTSSDEITAFGKDRPILVVLPKWGAAPDPRHRDWVRKAGLGMQSATAASLLKDLAASSQVAHREGVATPRLQGRGGAFAAGAQLTPGGIDRLQTLSGEGWTPELTDEFGRMVLAASNKHRNVHVLAEPDLINTQGLKSLETARVGSAVIDALRPASGGVTIDVSLAGFARGRSLLRTMLEPPLLGATLCALAAALLAGLHAFVRFGPPLRRARAVALGKGALVDNSAALVRMAHKEPRLLGAYADLVQGLAAKAAGRHAGLEVDSRTGWLARLGKLRGADANLEELVDEAGRAKGRADTLSVARKLHQWRLEVTRERE